MVLESENNQRLLDPTKQQVFDALARLDGVGNSYAFLEDDSESYIQVGGGPIEFTVEVRKTKSDGTFTHWKAELLKSKNYGERNIIISGSVVRVKSNQILDKKNVKQLFEAFMDGDSFPNTVKWIDMTRMFI